MEVDDEFECCCRTVVDKPTETVNYFASVAYLSHNLLLRIGLMSILCRLFSYLV